MTHKTATIGVKTRIGKHYWNVTLLKIPPFRFSFLNTLSNFCSSSGCYIDKLNVCYVLLSGKKSASLYWGLENTIKTLYSIHYLALLGLFLTKIVHTLEECIGTMILWDPVTVVQILMQIRVSGQIWDSKRGHAD